MNARIGIDGGGTKTEFILVDETGAVRARRTAGGCSPSLAARDTITALINDNLRALITGAGNPTITHTVFCMSGNRLFWREFIAGVTGYGAVQHHDDSIPILELATAGRPGLALHAGTGSFVTARGLDLAPHYAGGLGWRLGDPGSAHDLGRRAMARTELELQGWLPGSALGRAVGDHLGLHDANALSRHLYAPDTPQSLLASLAPLVTGLADADPIARDILADSAAALARLAQTVSQSLFGLTPPSPLPVGLSGVILHAPVARAAVTAVLGANHTLNLITEPPVEGVRRLLARL